MDSVINRVVDKGLCVRCGACIAACPLDVLHSGENLYPIAPDPDRCTSCELCIRICPGHEVDFPAMYENLLGSTFDYDNITGHVRCVYAAGATDQNVRETGSSGGLITAVLAHQINSGRIDGALVVSMNRRDPLSPVPVLATTVEEVVLASQSKYTIINPLTELRRPKSLPDRIAVAALPCQVHALRKWMAVDRRLQEKIKLIVGLVCNMTLEKEASFAILARKGIDPSIVARLEYRGGTWPGGIRVTLESGEIVKLHEGNIKDGAFNFLKLLYYPKRCLLCMDFSNDFADLSVADPWIRSGSGYLFPDNKSTVLTRTDRGEKALHDGIKEGALFAEKIQLSLLSEQFGSGRKAKRKGLSVRLHRLKEKGKPIPDYHVPIPDPSSGDKRGEAREALLRFPGKYKSLRKLGTFLAFSWPGRIIVKTKEFRRAR